MSSITGLCPKCSALRNAEILAEHEEVLPPTQNDPVARAGAYRILKCSGCDTIYFQREQLELIGHGVEENSIQTANLSPLAHSMTFGAIP